MNKKRTLLISAISIKALVVAAFIWSGSSKGIDEAQQSRNSGPTTFSPEIPLTLSFAGKNIDFDRYDMYERLDRELSSLTYLHSTTMLYIKRANRYFPIIVPILKQNGIPEDFKYMAVIESNLSERAVSPAKAVGLWQFLESTGKSYGLEVGAEVDERYHIEKSTVAACKYLKEAYSKYKDWVTVAASYNAGMGRISSELSKQQASSSMDLWLVEETSRYFFRMIACKEVMENPGRYGFSLKAHQLYKPIECKEITVDSSVPDWVTFAQDNGITYYQLRDFNTWIRSSSLINKTGKLYKVKIPYKDDMYYKKGEKPNVYDSRWVN